MDDLLSRRIKVDLGNYPYQVDLALRIHLKTLSQEAIGFLEELLLASLETKWSELLESTGLSSEQGERVLKEIQPLGLAKREGIYLKINKETRRILEVEIERFSEDFSPDLAFFKARLARVPASCLLDWYVVPRVCLDIFSSLVERYLIHPRLYARYVEESTFEDKWLQQIVSDLFKSPDYALSFKELKAKFGIDDWELHRLVLVLEFHMLAFLEFRKNGTDWEEWVVPLREWSEYSKWVKKGTLPLADGLVSKQPNLFIGQLEEDVRSLLGMQEVPSAKQFIAWGFQSRDEAKDWLQKGERERAFFLLRRDAEGWRRAIKPFSEKHLRGLEKRLREVPVGKWVSLDTFLDHLDVSLSGPLEPVLEVKGRRWSYTFPKQSEEDRQAFEKLMSERFARYGLIELGEGQGGVVFTLTSFGKECLC